MTYGTIKVDTVTFTNAGVDKSVTLSGLVQNPTFSGNVTVTGTLSGVTVTGTTANFTSGNFTNISGGTHTITSGVFAAGSAASPSITFTGDLNTGIYSPGADQVAISTGGSGRLFINSSGQVGIGTSASATLSLPNNGNINFVGPISYYDTNSAFSSGADRYVINGAAARYIQNAGTHSWQYAASGTAGNAISFNEAMRITSAGLVGIGTSSPISLCHISGPEGTYGQLRIQATGAGEDAVVVFSTVSNGRGIYLDESDSNKLKIYTGAGKGAAGEVVIDNSGRVGIGTTSPSELFHVNGNALVEDRLLLQRLQSSDNLSVLTFSDTLSGSKGNNLSLGNPGGFDLLFHTGGVEKARIDSSGRLGIGTSSPGSKLHIAGGATVVSIGSNDAGDTGAAIFYGTGTKYNWKIGAQQNVDNGFEITPSTAAGGTTFTTPALVVNPSGQVGIGTTSPSNVCEVQEAGTGNGLGGLTVSTASSAGNAGVIFRTSSSNRFSISLAGSAGSESLRFYDVNNSTERARIDSSGRLLVGTSSSSTTANSYTPSIQVAGSSALAAIATARYEASSGGPQLQLIKSRNSTIGSQGVVQNGDELGVISFEASDGSVFRQGARIDAVVDGTPGAADMPSRLVFSTTADGASSPTERMRISQNGLTRIFVTNGDGFQSDISVAAGTATATFVGRHSATGIGNGTTSFIVWSNGNVVNTNNSYGAISDIKLKENIVDATSQWSDIKALQVRKYNFKEGQTHTQIGLVAQEAELVSPGLVTESPDRDAEGNDLGTVTKSVNYSVLYMKAVKALQEAMERIETLEAKVAALESA